MSAILVVDNEKSMCDFLSIMLEKEGYSVTTANSGEMAANLIRENAFDVVITDIKMPRSNGIDVLETAKKVSPNTPVVMMTAYASHETAVEAMKKGAYDYLSKPFKIEDLQLIVKNAVEKKKLSDENFILKTALKDKYGFSSHVSKSPVMQKVLDSIQRVSDSNATVMITGESGAGKELAARTIHLNGPRKNHPFVSVNCGAIPENLLESELFGHEKGAFTSADSAKAGLMEMAHKGTFFLDEVCETPLGTQVKLLRVLQEKEFTRVGGTRTIKADLRIIAATNRDVVRAVGDKSFREDLYYRLNVIPIHLPPLRERREDIPFLVEYFIAKFNGLHQRRIPIRGIHPDALKVLERYRWPGNVRELENAVERAIVLEAGDLVQVSSLPEEILMGEGGAPASIPAIGDQPVDLEKTLDQIEKRMIQGALYKTNGIVHKAAKLLNLSFRSMRYRVQKHNLKGKTDGES
ncbi:MAG: sigma-54-dependent Fis family transcriptional regulator [Nitrospinae bacterium]|nr:sigma-54-dependent Fis family transcriptional regulator [Nitrospinota bacterium]